jgi:hypothetical protein
MNEENQYAYLTEMPAQIRLSSVEVIVQMAPKYTQDRRRTDEIQIRVVL